MILSFIDTIEKRYAKVGVVALNKIVVPRLAFLVGLGTIAFASIMRAGVRMREDLEGTI